MASGFPRKIFEMPFQNDPRPDIYKQLTLKNAEYPVTGINNSDCWLPDFSRAVELGNFVYRINVPGYFYKCPSGSSISSSGKSGIVIDASNLLMDTVQHHDHRLSATSATHVEIMGEVTSKARGVTRDDSWVTANYALSVDGTKDSAGDVTADINGDDSYRCKVTDQSIYNGTTNINGTMAHVAILSNQRRCPVYDIDNSGNLFARDLACNYVVHTGNNSCGAIMNSLVPIIPGVATTDKPAGGVLSEKTNEATIFKTIKLTNVSNKYFCVFMSTRNPALFPVHVKATNAVIEAEGTYVFANKTADKILFVPAKSVGSTVKPVTKIRSTTVNSCTYNIPSYNKTYTDDIGLNTSACAHYQAAKYAPVMASEIGKEYSFTINKGKDIYGRTIKTDYSGTITKCEIQAFCHDTAFDYVFREIFLNPPSDLKRGHSEKFVAQVLTLQDWPGTCTNSIGDINKHGVNAHKVFDPTSDGA